VVAIDGGGGEAGGGEELRTMSADRPGRDEERKKLDAECKPVVKKVLQKLSEGDSTKEEKEKK
jgi:hypothetical protein